MVALGGPSLCAVLRALACNSVHVSPAQTSSSSMQQPDLAPLSSTAKNSVGARSDPSCRQRY